MDDEVPPLSQEILGRVLAGGLGRAAHQLADFGVIASQRGVAEGGKALLPEDGRLSLGQGGLVLACLVRPGGGGVQAEEIRPGLPGAIDDEEPVQDQGMVEAGLGEIGIEPDGLARGGEGADEEGRLVPLLRLDGEGRRKVAPHPGISRRLAHSLFQRCDGSPCGALVRWPEEVRNSPAV